MRSSLKFAVALGIAAASTVIGPLAPANAATPCVHQSNGYTTCHNVYAAPVYEGNTNSSRVVGYMYSTYSTFSCKTDSGDYIGGGHPHRWVYTEADNGAWGMMKDTAIYDETDPIPTC